MTSSGPSASRDRRDQVIDQGALLAFQRHVQGEVRSEIAKAVYAGLEGRVTRGDFAQQEVAE